MYLDNKLISKNSIGINLTLVVRDSNDKNTLTIMLNEGKH